MVDYAKMYALLCCAVDDAIEPLKRIPGAESIAEKLQNALLKAEEIYIEASE